MCKTYKCPKCNETMKSNKIVWFCKKCDAFFHIKVPSINSHKTKKVKE